MEARGNYTRSCGVSKSREPNNDAQFVPGRLSFTILWGAGSLLSCEASWVTWSDVVARSVCGLEHPAGGRSSPAGARVERFRAFSPNMVVAGYHPSLPISPASRYREPHFWVWN